MSKRARGSNKLGLLFGGAVILSVFGYLLWGGIDSNLVYFLTPSELVAKGASAADAPLRLGGEVKPGSVQWNAATLDLRFELTDGGQTVKVQSKGAPPQMFREGQGVVVEGRYSKDGVFQSTNLMVKHSNEYKAPPHGQKPQQIYQQLPRKTEG